MIVSAMVFLATVSAIAAVAALVLERGALLADRPGRWFWAGSLVLGPALLAWGRLVPAGASGPGGPVFFLPEVTFTPGAVTELPVGALPELEVMVGIAWALASAGFLTWLIRTHVRLGRERIAWAPETLLSRSVLVSDDRGPAVAGILRPWIVLPRWSLALPEAELSLVLLHEEEHVRAGDTLLLMAALALVALTPWNPITWWQLRRLRLAMELDCDRRVLRLRPDPVRYGSSLLYVAARARGRSLGLATFTERSLSIERRIIAMTTTTTRWSIVGGGLVLAAGAVIAVQACGVDNPLLPDAERDIVEVEAPVIDPPTEADVVGEPTFTPFTVAPSILNRMEVIHAMEGAYPPLLRNAGVGGTVRIYFYIDETGRVQDTRVDRSSGHEAIDAAALSVASVYRFSPALNGDQKVPVWVSFPITFMVVQPVDEVR